MNFKKLKSQSGRSMVEMLGVLAIIGVLSVGGIAGYSLSMRRHRANQVVDAISKYAAISYGTCQQQILNGVEDGLTDDGVTTGCGSDLDMPSYTGTDLGALPAGVNGFWHGYTELDNISVIWVYFYDQKLCQAVASILGVTCTTGKVESYLLAKIKQN